jgi:tetratricopeptide (TPR) repeat protein
MRRKYRKRMGLLRICLKMHLRDRVFFLQARSCWIPFLSKPFCIGVFASLLLILGLHACSLPRIIVLDDPLTPEEHLNLGVAYEKNGELDAAIGEYEKASKKLPAAYLYMGNIFFQKDDYARAELHYRKAIEKDPGNADAYNNLAWLYYVKMENLEEAESLAEKALELNPSKKDIYQDTLDKIKQVK